MTQLQSVIAALPLDYNCTAVFEAIDPTTGNTVAGVQITNPSIYGVDLSGEAGGGSGQGESATPLWLPEPFDSPGN